MQSSLNPSDSVPIIRYIERGIEAKGHTPVYKMHRYFARRPHNVFRYLVEFYTKPGEIVLDCFCGGGVTLFEGLASGRRVVAVDLNPLATFISDCQTTLVPIQDYRSIIGDILTDMHLLTKQFYVTECRKCHKTADVRWFELAYKAKCRKCGTETLLSNENKPHSDGNGGRYVCQNCGSILNAVEAERTGYALVAVIYRCQCTHGRQKVIPNKEDIEKMENFEENFDRLIDEYDLWYPRDKIPKDWDRQLEDCLSRKSVNSFSDLFTKRSLFFNAYLLKCFRRYKNKVSPELYKMLIFTFSTIIRYTSNMTFSAIGWMDGRPVSWDKHAYWIPNQFVEVNPLEYLEKRRNAIVSGLRFQQSRLKNIRRVDHFSDLESVAGTHILWTRSSTSLPIPDERIDAIVTDPPYGSNVQYGELSHYWLVWLRQELGLPEDLMHLEDEILVHRRKQNRDGKTYEFYSDALRNVFSECYRILKPNGVLVFTFNNKDMRAWYAVIKAAIKAGFYLDKRGIIHQNPIRNYLNTSHTRYAGALHGDFICSFYKVGTAKKSGIAFKNGWTEEEIKKRILIITNQYLREHGCATTDELYQIVISDLTPILVSIAENDAEFYRLSDRISLKDIDGYFHSFYLWNEDKKVWCVHDSKETRKQT